MSLVNCSDGPPPLEASLRAAIDRLQASTLCMADELIYGCRHLPPDLPWRPVLQTSIDALIDLSTAIEDWLEAQEDPARG